MVKGMLGMVPISGNWQCLQKLHLWLNFTSYFGSFKALLIFIDNRWLLFWPSSALDISTWLDYVFPILTYFIKTMKDSRIKATKTITKLAKEKKKNPDGGNCGWYQCQQNCRVCNELLSQSMGWKPSRPAWRDHRLFRNGDPRELQNNLSPSISGFLS